MHRRVPVSQKRNQAQSGEWPGEEGKGDEPFTTGLPLLGRKGDTRLTLAVLVCPGSPCPSLSGHLSRLRSSGDPCDRAFLNWKRLGRRQEGHAKQDCGGGEGMSQLPREASALHLQSGLQREPQGACVSVLRGGVTNSFLSPCKGDPPHPTRPSSSSQSPRPVSDTSLLPAPPPHPSLLGFKKPLVIQEFPNSVSLPCSEQAAKHGFRDPGPYYLFLNARYCISPSLQALVSGLRLGPSETPGLGNTHLNVMVCEFGPKFPACPEVQQGHLGLRDGESDAGGPPMLPIICGSARAHPSVPPNTPPPARVPDQLPPGTPGFWSPHFNPSHHEAEGTWLLFWGF